jgi:ABC-type transport system involved in cytochrome c biogenesis permease subunit
MPALTITILCFGASYAVALTLELLQLFQPRPVLRLLSLGFGGAGLLAHTLFVLFKPLTLASPFGSLVFLAWILAVFYLYGSIHHHHLAWGLFVLPLVLGLTVLAALLPEADGTPGSGSLHVLAFGRGERFWGVSHGSLVLLAAVGMCVGFVASVMYLVQVHRLRAKVHPGHGVRLLSLERLEAMNRRAIILAFPLLTLGLLVGITLLLQSEEYLADWTNPKVLSALGLWLVFALLALLRYGAHWRGRPMALLTIVAFVLLLGTLAVPAHSFVQGVGQ